MRSSFRLSFRRKRSAQSQTQIDAPALLHTLRRGSMDGVQQLFSGNNSTNINRLLPDGALPLHVAVDAERADVVEFLLQNGAGVNSVDQAGWTALHHAVYNSNIEIVKLLLQHGADSTMKAGNFLPVDLAMGCDEIMTELLLPVREEKKTVVRKESSLSCEVFLAKLNTKPADLRVRPDKTHRRTHSRPRPSQPFPARPPQTEARPSNDRKLQKQHSWCAVLVAF